jgi:predicted nucleic acid-binding protein
MDAATAHAAARWLTQVPLQVVESVIFMTDAMALSIRLQHPACACFYLALARQAGCPLVIADKRLVERCQRADVADLNEMVVPLVATGLSP